MVGATPTFCLSHSEQQPTTHKALSRHYLPQYNGAVELIHSPQILSARATRAWAVHASYQDNRDIYPSLKLQEFIIVHLPYIVNQLFIHLYIFTMPKEKHEDIIEPAQSSTESIIGKADLEDGEVFRTGEGLVNFRTVSWIHTSVIFLKRKCSSIAI